LEIVLTPPADWHVYARADDVPAVGPRPTLIEFDPSVTLRPEAPKTSQPVIEVDQSDIGWDAAHIHDGQVRWTSEIRVPEDVKAGRYVLSGVIGYQACDTADGTCEIPKGVRFEVPVEVSDRITSLSTQLNFAAAQYNDAKALAAASDSLPIAASGPVSATAEYDLESVVIGADAADRSILHYVVLAFVGGIILNLMPCVLPVIGLKVMSFVEQAGHSRSHALALNLWYSAGIVAVFLVLAGLAISLGFSWGGQFSSTAFNVTLAALVFAMALSLLGVWEIPIPGFLGSGSAQSMAAKEGPTGAFLKGVITTVLATPCTGPFMATALGWAVRQTPATTLTVFASMGLGMASPYLLIGAFPSLVRHLPKPGAWMETFKQLMGFVLLGTVVFLFSFMDPAAIVPTVALLVGVGIACWTMSRTPLTAEFKERLEAWLMAGAVTLLASVFAFGWLYPKVTQPRLEARVAAAAREMGGGQLVSDEPWQPFSLAALQRVAVEQGRTVLVDFSAEWCLTCKALENTVLHTDAVDKAIDDSEVVTMYGDFTDYPEEIDRTIKALGSNGVPVIAIFPGDDPYHPIVFRGAYTQGGLLAAIEEATTSRDARSAERVARKQ
jgi:thiol:disulfide interchange protein DsbD